MIVTDYQFISHILSLKDNSWLESVETSYISSARKQILWKMKIPT